MAKYNIALILFAILAFENNSIYVRSHPSSVDPSRHQLEHPHSHHPHYRHNDHSQQIQQQQQQHNQHHSSAHHYHRDQQSQPAPPPLPPPLPPSVSQLLTLEQEENIDSDTAAAAAAMQRYLHLQRHMERQREHLAHHQEHYHHQQNHSIIPPNTKQNHTTQLATPTHLKQMPRVWQHLQNVYNDDSAADADADEEEEVEHVDAEEERMYADSPIIDSGDLLKDANENLQSHIPPPVYEEQPEDIIRNHQESESLEFNINNALESNEESYQRNDNNNNNNSNSNRDSSIISDNRQHSSSSSSSNIPPTGCPKCESSRSVAHVTEEELTRLRIEFVKQQILEKLRLKERPNVSAVGLPKPIYDGATIEPEDDESKSKELDDYYARTSKKFIFLKRETRECQRLGSNSSMCFSFKIDDADADGFDVNNAVLWIFKNKQQQHRRRNATSSTILEKETIVVSELQQQLDTKYLPLVKTIAIQTVDVQGIQDEWMKIDIEWPIKRWFGNHDLSHLIQISCQSCDMNTIAEMISVDKDYRPFIMVDTQNRRRASRKKRGINCADGVTECCREKLYISFDEIGWGDWIIQPRGYDAYFCRGACASIASVSQSASYHSTFLQKVLSHRRSRGDKSLELIPCCTAKQYSSLQLVFMESNSTATQKTFPNMVVESCGCR